MLSAWRSESWRNAEHLLAARTPAQRAQVQRTIELGVAGRARLITSLTSNLVIGPRRRAPRQLLQAARMTQVVGYVVSSPPSTGSNAPVMIDDASLARKWRGDQLPMLALAAGGPAMRGPL